MEVDGAPYRDADYVVDADPAARGDLTGRPFDDVLQTSAAIDLVERLGDNASGLGRVTAAGAHRQRGPIGVGDDLGETAVGTVATARELRWQKLVTGRFPERTGEAVVHVWDANALNIAVGDHVRIGPVATATDLDVVGLVESPSTWTQASVYVTWQQYVQWRDQPGFHVGSLAVRGEVGPLPEGMRIEPAQEYVTDSLATLNNGTDALAIMLLVFAAVALFVSALVIANTFSILFAQRLRDFALLRCVGATRRQLLGSVRREAAAVGVLAALAGTLAGLGLGYGLIALINALAPRAPMAAPAPPTLWLLGGFAVGLLVTMVASWLPTRQAVRVSPLAALRPEPALDVHTATGRVDWPSPRSCWSPGRRCSRRRWSSTARSSWWWGGSAFFVGVLLVGPVLRPPPGPDHRRAARSGRAAGDRERRAQPAPDRHHHRRAAGRRHPHHRRPDRDDHLACGDGRTPRHPAPHRRRVQLGRPAGPTDLLDQVRRTPGVERAIAVDGAVATITGWAAPVPVVTAPGAAQVARDGGRFAQVPVGTIHLDREAFRSEHTELGLRPGDRVTVRVGDRQTELKVVLLAGWGKVGVVAPETLAQLTDAPAPQVLWVRAAADVDPIQLVDELDGLAEAAGTEFDDQLQPGPTGTGSWTCSPGRCWACSASPWRSP